MNRAHRTWRFGLMLILVAAACSVGAGAPEAVLGRLGVTKGICVVLGDRGCELALGLARESQLTVYVQLGKAEDVRAACEAADAAGLYGTRIYVAKGSPSRIGLADNYADAVVTLGGLTPSKAEVLRVLRPGGKALVGNAELTKPFPEGMDDWSHNYHGPDNNTQSRDRLARAPYLTQFIVEPRYGPAPQNTVASGGRVFMAFGNVAWHPREEPWLDTLVALNGFNGTMLWKRKLPSGIMVDRSTMIATPKTLYLADDESCKLLDPETGEVRDEIVAPTNLAGGTFWKWMALDGGVLYALVGQAEPPDKVKRWKRRGHGWPWGGISDGYNAKKYPWGFASTLFAIDPKTKKVLWHHTEAQPIDSRCICMKNGRIYLGAYGSTLACLDSRNGREVWRRTAATHPDLFKAMGAFNHGHGYRSGWKSSAYLRCSDKALYFCGPQVYNVSAVSADDGHHLWTYPAKINPHVVIRGDGLYIIGAQGIKSDTKKLDQMTGQVLANYGMPRRACTRATGSVDSIFFRSHGDGTDRLDMTTGKTQWLSPMRPSCFTGVVIANGHLYWVPWVCDCNLQMFGAICCAPAGDFKFDQAARQAERLEPGSGAANAPFAVAEADWPTYRANNLRTATTEAVVPAKAGLLWAFKPKSVFAATAPVAAGGLVLVGGSDGIVRALDAASGAPRWRAYTGGAVRYPPALAGGRALVGSGDGYAYAFEAATGRRLWRFRAAPVERRIRIYDSLLSTWPVSGGVLVEGDTACFAAGINNFDGTHVYAVDAATGKLRWHNATAGGVGASFGRGAGAQGDLLLLDGKLYMAGGSAASPAVFDIKTGSCVSRGGGGRRGRELVFAETRDKRGQLQRRVNVVGQPLYSDPENPVYSREVKWDTPVVHAKNADLSCHQRGGGWQIVATERGRRGLRAPRASNRELWAQPLPGEPVRWAVAVDAKGRIVVTLRDGRVLCFGDDT